MRFIVSVMSICNVELSLADNIHKIKLANFIFPVQVLGDIMESITGAIFIDVNFNIDMVWKIVEPLLSPMITPDKLALPPYRELLELCSHLGCFINSKCTSKGEELIIEMTVQLQDELLIAQGHDRNRKSANAKAAARILVDLKVCFLKQKQK